jgi:hypothetical protein
VKWRKIISQQAKSGQSVAAFCRERGLCGPHFFAWKKRLREQGARPGEGAQLPDAPARKFVEVKVVPAFVQPAAASAAIEVRLQNGRSLVVGPGFDSHHLRTLVAVLEGEA